MERLGLRIIRQGVALEMRRVLRVRRVRSCEEGRAEREHERLREGEEPSH